MMKGEKIISTVQGPFAQRLSMRTLNDSSEGVLL